MTQLDLFTPSAPVLAPVDPDGPVIQGAPDVTLRLPHPRLAWDLAVIELHEHEDGRWMWAVSGAGGGYKVGPKWGRFAATQEEAMRFAAIELHDKIKDRDPDGMSITPAQKSQILDFAKGMF